MAKQKAKTFKKRRYLFCQVYKQRNITKLNKFRKYNTQLMQIKIQKIVTKKML